MKKKLNIILLMFTIFLSSITYVDEVWGVEVSTGVQSVPNGEAASCGGENCYSLGTSGIRFMLVDKEGNRVSKTDGTGADTDIVEYWFYSTKDKDVNLFYTYESGTVVYFKDIRMKQDLLKLVKGENNQINYATVNNYIDVTTDKPMLESIEKLGPNILDNFNNKFSFFDNDGKIVANSDNGIYYCADSNKHVSTIDNVCKYGGNEIKFKTNTRVNNASETIMKIITEDANSKNSKGYLNNLLKDMGLVNGISDLGENYFLQAEPLAQWNNNRLSSYCGHTNVTFLGTPTEFTLLKGTLLAGELNTSNPTGLQKSLGLKNTKLNTEMGNEQVCAFNDNNTKKFYELSTVGIYTPPSVDMPNKITLTPLGTIKIFDLTFANALQKLETTMGVGFISLKDFGGSCNDSARNILKSKNIEGISPRKINNYTEIEKEFKKNKKILEVCYGGKEENKLDEEKCLQLTQEYLENVGVSPNGDLCDNITCNDLVVNTINKTDFSNDYKNKNGTYYKMIEYLFYGLDGKQGAPGIFSDQNGLDPILWHDFFDKKATCKIDIPSCPPASSSVTCNTSSQANQFIISDTDNIDGCIKKGWAYNDKKENSNYISVLQSSKDRHYSSMVNGSDVYCSESVEFEFPGKGHTLTAGTVFKWGIDNDKKSNKFGTMTVERVCYFDDVFRSNTEKVTLDSKWVDSVNPNINIYYEHAVDKSINVEPVDANLSVDLFKFYSRAYTSSGRNALDDFNCITYNPDGSIDKNECGINDRISVTIKDNKKTNDSVEYSGNNPRQFTCNNSVNNSCKDLDRIEMVATYDIIYNDDFTWYADKANNGELVSSKDLDSEADSSYVFAGYGLPSIYPSADNEMCSQWIDGAGSDEFDDTNGELRVHITNIGTSTGGNSYHFTNMINSKLLKDDDVNDNDTVDYYCDFKVNNPLFDYEYSFDQPYECVSRTPKGIDIVFRTVELTSSAEEKEIDEAFPGRSGTGNREIGYNWSKYDNETIAKILKNTVDEQKDPMYEITLDSPTVQMIRSWNNAARDNNIDPYTYMGTIADGTDSESIGYSSYSIVSVNSEGEVYKESEDAEMYKLVKSDFLSALSVELDDDHFSSICVDGDSHVFNCNQSWWLDEAKKKNTITITEKSIEEE